MHQPFLHEDEDEKKKAACACCTSRRLKWGGFISSAFGIALLVVAVVLPVVIQNKLDSGIDTFTSISPSAMSEQTKGFMMWSDTGSSDATPVYQDVYMFNITNPTEILANNATKPNVTQFGPYVYREVKVKFDLQYGVDYNEFKTVQYREWVYWQFEPTLSAPGLDPDTDRYTTFNLPFQAVTNAYKKVGILPLVWSSLEKACGDVYPTDLERLFTNEHSVTELLFGYKDCITVAASLPASGITPAGTFPGLLGTNLPPSVNNTQASIGNLTAFTSIYTGEDIPANMRQYVQFNEESYLTVDIGPVSYDVWGSAFANRVYGTEGTQYAPNVKANTTLTTFVPELSRAVPLINVDSLRTNDLHGIDLLRFTLDPKILLNSSVVPENAAFYCWHLNGLLNITIAKQGLPIFMSKPHFLDADAVLVEDIIGMAPNTDAHDTRLDVEPLTGVTMRANKRLQANFMTSTFTDTWVPTFYPDVGTHFVPVAWFDLHGELSSSQASQFKNSVYAAQDAIKYVRSIGAAVGGALVAFAVVLAFIAISRAKKEQARIQHINA